MIDLSPGSVDMPLRQDRGLVAAHRILDRLAKQENAEAKRNAG